MKEGGKGEKEGVSLIGSYDWKESCELIGPSLKPQEKNLSIEQNPANKQGASKMSHLKALISVERSKGLGF